MEITLELLKKLNACEDGLDWFGENINEPIEHDALINKLIEYNIQWAVWLIVRLLTRKNQIRLTIYAAKKALPIFERKYPNDNRPRKAIEDTEKYLNNEISIGELIESRNAAYAAARATDDAAYAIYAAAKADDAVYATDDAAHAIYAADDTVNNKTSLIDTINYGLELMKNNEE